MLELPNLDSSTRERQGITISQVLMSLNWNEYESGINCRAGFLQDLTMFLPCGFTQSNPDKEGQVAVYIVLIRCCKWTSFQKAEYNCY